MTATTKINGVVVAAALGRVADDGRGHAFALAEDVTLTMAVPDWPPTRIMKKFFDEQYKPKSGNTVKLDVDFIPWPDFYTRVNASLTSGEQKYNFIVSDSQWLGAFVEGGYYRKINDLIDADPELQEDVHGRMHPESAERLFDLSAQVARTTTASRSCRTCWSPSPARTSSATRTSRRTSRRSTTRSCPARAKRSTTWTGTTFENIGEFFQRKKGEKLAGKPADDDFYGIAYQAGKGYDFSSMQVNGFIWQYGGDIWDETKAPEGPGRRRRQLAGGGEGARALSRA